MFSPPYTTITEEVLAEIAQGAERRLQAQLTAALAADQRALIFAGFTATAAVALAGAAASLLSGGTFAPFLGWLALAAAVGMIVAMALATYAARPARWFFPGVRPADWTEDVAQGTPRLKRLQDLVADYENRVDRNEELMAANGSWLRLATIVAFATLVLGSLLLGLYAWGHPPPGKAAETAPIRIELVRNRAQ